MFFCASIMLNAQIKNINGHLVVAHANIPSVDTEGLKRIVESKGYDISPISNSNSRSRNMEWLSIRLLLFEVLQKAHTIMYHENGKPYLLESDANISFSHSKKKIALVVDPKNPTGIDIQKKSEKLFALQSKFLHPLELSRKAAYNLEELSVMWSVKEAVYKVYGHPEIFLRNILVDPFIFDDSGSEISASLKMDGKEFCYQLKYELLNDYVMAYVVNP